MRFFITLLNSTEKTIVGCPENRLSKAETVLSVNDPLLELHTMLKIPSKQLINFGLFSAVGTLMAGTSKIHSILLNH